MTEQNIKITQKIEELKVLQTNLNKRISQLNEYKNIELYDDIRKDYYDKITLCNMDIEHKSSNPYESAIYKLKDLLDQYSDSYGSFASKYGICFNLNKTSANGNYQMEYVYNILNKPSHCEDIINIKEGCYIRCIHIGSYHTANISIDSLINYAHKNNLSIIGNAFFVPLINSWETTSETNYKSEILIPVK